MPPTSIDTDLSALLAQVNAIQQQPLQGHAQSLHPSYNSPAQQPQPSMPSISRLQSRKQGVSPESGGAAPRLTPGYPDGQGLVAQSRGSFAWGVGGSENTPPRLPEVFGVPGPTWNRVPSVSHSSANPGHTALQTPEADFMGFAPPHGGEPWQPETPQIFSRRGAGRTNPTPSTGVSPYGGQSGTSGRREESPGNIGPSENLLAQLGAFRQPEGAGFGGLGSLTNDTYRITPSGPRLGSATGEPAVAGRGYTESGVYTGRSPISPGKPPT
jgi:hypothetical protein